MANEHSTTGEVGRAWPLLVACLLHVALFALLNHRAADAAPAELNPIDVTIEEQTPPTDELHAPQGLAEAKAPDPASASRRSSSTSQADDSMAPPVDSATPPVPQDVLHTENGDAPWTFRSTRGGIDLGLGDKTGSLARQMLANGGLEMPKEPLPPAPPAPIDPGVKMIQELDAQDVARGFGRGGPVVQAIETAVRDAVPSEGSATFEVAIEKSGGISVRVLEAALNRAEWERLTDAIAVIVKTKHIRFPSSGLGLRIGVKVAASDHAPPAKKMSFTDGPVVAPGTGNPSGRDDAAMQQGGSTPMSPMMMGGGFPTGGGGSQSRIVSAHEVYEQRM